MITCPACKQNLRRELHLDQHAKRPGDLTMCGNCETLLVIGDDLKPRKLDQVETDIVNRTPALCAYLRVLRRTVQRSKRQREAARN
jgi:RNase P subunit RPR2